MPVKTELQSAPERILFKDGTEQTFELLYEAAQNLSPTELLDLEGDLELYAQTRLIGIHMSRLLKLLKRRALMTARRVTAPYTGDSNLLGDTV